MYLHGLQMQRPLNRQDSARYGCMSTPWPRVWAVA